MFDTCSLYVCVYFRSQLANYFLSVIFHHNHCMQAVVGNSSLRQNRFFQLSRSQYMYTIIAENSDTVLESASFVIRLF